jgi:uncharacterized protein (TIGR02266 family)
MMARLGERHMRVTFPESFPPPLSVRSEIRVPTQLPVEVELGGERYVARTRNLSLGGMFIETELVFPLGASIVVRFRLTPDEMEIIATAQVRWIERDIDNLITGCGLRLAGLRPAEVYALQRFVR